MFSDCCSGIQEHLYTLGYFSFCTTLVSLDHWEDSTKGRHCYGIADVSHAKFCFLPFRMHSISPSLELWLAVQLVYPLRKHPRIQIAFCCHTGGWGCLLIHCPSPSKARCRPQNSSGGTLTAARFSIWASCRWQQKAPIETPSLRIFCMLCHTGFLESSLGKWEYPCMKFSLAL